MRLALSDRPASIVIELVDIEADAVLVDALARAVLECRRHGCRVHLDPLASPELIELIELMGLGEALLLGR